MICSRMMTTIQVKQKLSGKIKDLWSFSIEYNQRAVFYFIDPDKIVFIDIGNHDQVY